MLKRFTEHPASINETYLTHLKFALSFGLAMVRGGLASMMHAIFPFMFETTGSQIVFNELERFLRRKPNKDKTDVALLECILERKDKSLKNHSILS